MNKEEKINAFDPSGMSAGNQLFGLPFNEEESDIVILPVPWEVTVSYRAGTAKAPRAILEASGQVDLYDGDVQDAWKQGIYLKKVNKQVAKWSKELRAKAANYLSYLEDGVNADEEKFLRKIRDQINTGGTGLKEWVREEMLALLRQGKLPGMLGGDHSTPLGFMEALGEVYPEYGILQIDAHCDLRNAYEGFTYSHASIMYNALKIQQVKKLVQVGIRDFCQEEIDVIHQSNGRVKTFFDADLKRSMYEGESWKELCHRIVSQLPPLVYISFDIDGLDPKLCPNTGTPVAGGLEFEQAVYLVFKVVRSGRKIIGFDLNEVVPGATEWDANVGARMLYKLCNLMGLSHRMFKESEEHGELPVNDELVIKQKPLKEEDDRDRDLAD
ncbi:MAG: agmatinase family protein [Chitinophagales bacterium]